MFESEISHTKICFALLYIYNNNNNNILSVLYSLSGYIYIMYYNTLMDIYLVYDIVDYISIVDYDIV